MLGRQKKRPDYIGTVAYMGGVPSVPEPFLWSMLQMQIFNTAYIDGNIDYQRAKISYHADARNDLAKSMKGDWLFQMDTDHVFHPDVLARLLDRMERYEMDIVTGLYQYKSAPFAPLLYMFDKEKAGVRLVSGWNPNMPIIEVEAAGGGCLLVKRSVFERVREHFDCEPFDVMVQENGKPLSEDLSFFWRCKELGIKTFCDTRVRYNHLRWDAVDLEKYEVPAPQLDKLVKVAGYKN